MFAFAIWDRHERKLFLARDRFGKKPLFWTMLGGRFYFASTIDAFTAVPDWTGRILPSAIALYGRLGAFPNDLTVFEQARALRPGHYATIAPDRLLPKIERYWRLRFPARRYKKFDEAADEYENVLTDAIRLRLRADVPVAITFSGGVDSGTISALAAKQLGTKLTCFTIDYDAEDDPSAETAVAKAAATHLGLDWKYLHYDYRRILFDDAIHACQAFDQPCNHVAMAYSQRLYDSIRPDATVVLSGGGADELFTGYVGDHLIYRRDQFQRYASLLPASLRRMLPPSLRSLASTHLATREDLIALQSNYLAAGVAPYSSDDPAVMQVSAIMEDLLEAGVESHLDLRQYVSLYFFGSSANFLLPDITGLRAQVEVRSPYLDYRMVELAARLPGHFKVGDAGDPQSVKRLPKAVYERFVPKEIATAPKKGMAMNIKIGDTFAKDARFAQQGERALSRIEDVGLDARDFRAAWANFVSDFQSGKMTSPAAGTAMAGFMLGMWLDRKPVGLETDA
jgi:asparagine synthase (glutamine-hydrolysing)